MSLLTGSSNIFFLKDVAISFTASSIVNFGLKFNKLYILSEF